MEASPKLQIPQPPLLYLRLTDVDHPGQDLRETGTGRVIPAAKHVGRLVSPSDQMVPNPMSVGTRPRDFLHSRKR
jgi:hypothetical protein